MLKTLSKNLVVLPQLFTIINQLYDVTIKRLIDIKEIIILLSRKSIYSLITTILLVIKKQITNELMLFQYNRFSFEK